MVEPENPITNLKITIVGEMSVGKTSLLKCYTDSESKNTSDVYEPTIGIDFFRKKIENYNNTNKKIILNFFDTAGQERFKTITSSFYKGSHAIIIMYSVNDRDSFIKTEEWKLEAQKFTNTNTKFYLVGGKIDLKKNLNDEELETKGLISKSAGEAKSTNFNYIKFFEVSTKVGYKDTVDNLFDSIVQDCCLGVFTGAIIPRKSIIINNNDEKKNQCKC